MGRGGAGTPGGTYPRMHISVCEQQGDRKIVVNRQGSDSFGNCRAQPKDCLPQWTAEVLMSSAHSHSAKQSDAAQLELGALTSLVGRALPLRHSASSAVSLFIHSRVLEDIRSCPSDETSAGSKRMGPRSRGESASLKTQSRGAATSRPETQCSRRAAWFPESPPSACGTSSRWSRRD